MSRITLLPTVLLVALLTSGMAQSVHGEIGYTTDLIVTDGAPARASWAIKGRLEASYALAPFELLAIAAPTLRVREAMEFELGLTSAFARYRTSEVDVSIGLERLPLETARLAIPFGIEPVTREGVRIGVPGVRIRWYPEAASVRAGIFVLHDGPGGVVSVRHELGSAELEGHLVLSGTRLAVGLGGSGLMTAWVVYGEAWVLTGPLDVRGALGVSGVLEEMHWTLEVAYLAETPERQARPAIFGQIAFPEAQDQAWHGALRVFFDEDAVRAHVALAHTRTQLDRDVRLQVVTNLGPEPFGVGLELSVRRFF